MKRNIGRSLAKAMSSPLGKAALVAVGAGGVAAGAEMLLRSGALDGLSPNAKGTALRQPGQAGATGPGSGSQAPSWQMSRSGVQRPQYQQTGTYSRGKFISPYNPLAGG